MSANHTSSWRDYQRNKLHAALDQRDALDAKARDLARRNGRLESRIEVLRTHLAHIEKGLVNDPAAYAKRCLDGDDKQAAWTDDES